MDTWWSASKKFMSQKVKQVSCGSPEYSKHIGRYGTVTNVFTDEKDQVFLKTIEDGIWCPEKYMEIISQES